MYSVDSVSKIEQLKDIKRDLICLIQSKETNNLYLCKINSVDRYGDLSISVLDSDYIRYRREGGNASQTWRRDFDHSKLYTCDPNDIHYWKGK